MSPPLLNSGRGVFSDWWLAARSPQATVPYPEVWELRERGLLFQTHFWCFRFVLKFYRKSFLPTARSFTRYFIFIFVYVCVCVWVGAYVYPPFLQITSLGCIHPSSVSVQLHWQSTQCYCHSYPFGLSFLPSSLLFFLYIQFSRLSAWASGWVSGWVCVHVYLPFLPRLLQPLPPLLPFWYAWTWIGLAARSSIL